MVEPVHCTVDCVEITPSSALGRSLDIVGSSCVMLITPEESEPLNHTYLEDSQLEDPPQLSQECWDQIQMGQAALEGETSCAQAKPTPEELKKLKVAELKAKLGELGLSEEGKKADLLQRLEDYWEGVGLGSSSQASFL